MKKVIFIALLGGFWIVNSQESFQNYGNLQIHDQGKIGFHTDLVNDGRFDQNMGFVGFYNSDRPLTISGANVPTFHELLTDVKLDLILEVGVGVTHFFDLVSGRIITPRNDPNIYIELLNDTPYIGSKDTAHTDGYLSNTGVLEFTFPIGDDFRLRPMRVNAGASLNTSKGAYFFEDPNTASTFGEFFDTTKFEPTLSTISPFEFWDLSGSAQSKVTLTWDELSQVYNIADDIKNLRVVGWSSEKKQWINLGSNNVNGNLSRGELTSDLIAPDDYTILTIGSVLGPDEDISVYEAISPNGDGLNDQLIIKGIDAIPDNELFIYNRWGREVYRKKGYDNSWNGFSELPSTPQKSNGLPVGTYFYVLKINGQQSQVGYFYIQR